MRMLRSSREVLGKIVHRIKHSRIYTQKTIKPLIELVIITAWAFWVGRAYLNFDLSLYPHGGDYSLTIQPNTIWQYLDRCGLCILWNGFSNGGFPTFTEIHSAFLHPLVVVCTLIWGTLNGAKITLILGLALAGWAQWWLARTLKLGLVARLWSAGMAVVGGNLAGRMELGLLGILLSTASCSLVIAAGVNLAINRRRTSIVAFAVTLTLALLSGQGYMQIGLVLGIFPAFLIFILDRSLKPNSIFKQFAIAFGLALLLCGLLLIPTLHFLPNYAKETDASIRAVQPMGYTLLNLVIHDITFFQNDSLGKMGFPAIYINYVGWPVILLALAAFWLSPPDNRKPLRFFGVGFLLVLAISSEELILFLSNRIPGIISMIRYPPLIAGLLVPLVLGMGAISLDRLIQINWPKLSLDVKKRSKLQLPLLWLVLAVPLSLNLSNAYQFGQNWLVVAKVYPDIQRLGSAIPNPGSVWVQPPVGSFQWDLELIEDGHKVTHGFRPWHWKYRAFPPPSFQAFSPQDEIPSGDIIAMVDEIRVVEYSDVHYAAVLSQRDGITPCSAQSIGGHINVQCSTQTPGRLIIYENSYPGWVAYRDEEKVLLNQNTFLEVDAPPGVHTYQFRYLPLDVLIGACLTLTGIALSIRMLLLESSYRPRPRNGSKKTRRGKDTKHGKPARPKLEQSDDPADSKVLILSNLTRRISSLDFQWIPISILSLGQSNTVDTDNNQITRVLFLLNGISGAVLLIVSLKRYQSNTHSILILFCIALATLYHVIVVMALVSKSLFERLIKRALRLSMFLKTSANAIWVFTIGIGCTISGSLATGGGSKVFLPYGIALWLLGISLVTLALRSQQARTDSYLISKNEAVIFMLILIAGFTIRITGLDSMPHVLSGDEGSVGLVGWEFIEGFRDNLLGLGWFSFPTLYSWLLSLSQTIVGRSILAIRLVSSIVGTLSIAATYLGGKILFNRKVGLIAATWLTTFHYHVFFSRIAYNNIFDGLFLVLCVGFLFRGWKNNSRSDFLLLGFFLGFSQYFYTTSHAIPIILLLWLPWLHLRHAKFNTRHQHLLATILVAGSITLPLITTYFSHPETLTFTAGRVSLLDPTLLGPAAKALGTTPFGLVLEQTLVTGLGLTVSELQGIYLDSGRPMLFGLSAIIFVLGLLLTLVRWRRSRNAILLITIIISIIIGGLSIQAPSSQRLVLLPPIIALIIATMLVTSRGWFNNQWPHLRIVSSILLLSGMSWMAFENIRQLFWEYYPNEHYGSLNGEVAQEMIEFLQEETPEADIYFIGGERMQFDSIPSIAYLQPTLHAESAERLEDLVLPASIDRRTIFIILPEQISTLELVASTFPDSAIIARYNRHGRLLFYVRIIEPTQST